MRAFNWWKLIWLNPIQLQSQEQLRRDLGGWREERVCLMAQLGVCRSKAEAQTRKTDLAKEKLVEVMHCYEQRTQTLLLDMDHLQAAYARSRSSSNIRRNTGRSSRRCRATLIVAHEVWRWK